MFHMEAVHTSGISVITDVIGTLGPEFDYHRFCATLEIVGRYFSRLRLTNQQFRLFDPRQEKVGSVCELMQFAISSRDVHS